MSKTSLLLLVFFLATTQAWAQTREELRQGRQRDWDEHQTENWLRYLGSLRYTPNATTNECERDVTTRRDAIMNGNKITTQISNFGSISSPGNAITNIVWNRLGYGYEFGPLVGAEIVDNYREEGRPRHSTSVPQRDDAGNVVRNAQGDTVWVMHIISEGLVSNGGERSPNGDEWWGWQPIPCAEPVGSFQGLQVVNPNSDRVPTSDAEDANLDGKPDSWPDAWYNEVLGEYVWPGALRQGASNADKEALYFMNDYDNKEFPYYPFENDPNKRGLGLEVEVRIYQWANPLAEDAIFLIYKISNKSDKDLEKVRFGMWGDPHIGGNNDWSDDLAYFDRNLSMVYAWDANNQSQVPGRPPGYFGFKFLESPGISDDGIDNDGDGMIDESWTDGIDNDGDWDPDLHDVGIDGIPLTGDEGEGDGIPTAGDPWDIRRPGEPNFEFTDIDESDQLGLTSFRSPPFAGNRVDNDARVWEFIEPGTFDQVPSEPGDYVFIFGSGQFALRAGETKRFSVALILGENFDDLTLNAQTVQQIYDAGYVFAKPPEKPVVTAVPGDKKVTLYWDSGSEASVDPLTGEEDFEGYVIYRSTTHDFADQQVITDINGSKFLFQPLKTVRGVEAKFDLQNDIKGPSPVPYPQRGVAYDLGDDTGLFHTFVDSNNVINGQRYFYTVVAYDRGSVEDGIPPAETTKIITYNPTTDQYIFDVNTVSVIPGPRVAGFVPPQIAEGGVQRVSGHGTGAIDLQIVNEFAVEEGNSYRIEFDVIGGQTVYSVIDEKPVELDVTLNPGRASSLLYTNLVPGTVSVTAGGQTLAEGTDYTVNYARGTIEPVAGGQITGATETTVRFQYAPVVNSNLLASEEANPIFDGIQLFVQDQELALNQEASGFTSGGEGIGYWRVRPATTGRGGKMVPYDYEITFSDTEVETSFSNNVPLPFTIKNLTRGNTPVKPFVQDQNRNGAWDLATEAVSFLEDLDNDGTYNPQTELTWELTFNPGPNEPNPNVGASLGTGDVFFIRTIKPFADDDTFTFTTVAATDDPALTSQQLKDIYVVPNPYVATNVLEPLNPTSSSERGERRLYFANVPRQCTIRIYTLAGELVDVIEHDSTLDNGKVYWDLRTKDNMNIAYGLYFFHVEAPEGSFIGKFAVIK